MIENKLEELLLDCSLDDVTREAIRKEKLLKRICGRDYIEELYLRWSEEFKEERGITNISKKYIPQVRRYLIKRINQEYKGLEKGYKQYKKDGGK